MRQYSTDEIRTIVNNCNTINEIFKASDQLQVAMKFGMVNPYYRTFINKVFNKKIDIM